MMEKEPGEGSLHEQMPDGMYEMHRKRWGRESRFKMGLQSPNLCSELHIYLDQLRTLPEGLLHCILVLHEEDAPLLGLDLSQ
jgi:hypothetical protein